MPVAVCCIAGTRLTAVSKPGTGMAPVVMWNERFCQKILFSSNGLENFVQFGWPAQVTLGLVITPDNRPLFKSACRPATMKLEVVTDVLLHAAGGGTSVGSQPGGGTLPFGATLVSKSTPAVAVLSLDTTVLLMKFTFN